MKKTALFLALIIALSVCGCSSTPQKTELTYTESPAVGWEYDDTLDQNNTHPVSFDAITLTLHNADTMTYGITWNTLAKVKDQTVQVCEGDTFNPNTCTEFEAAVRIEKRTMHSSHSAQSFLYISKAVVAGLEPDKTYSYRCYDKNTSLSSDVFTFTTRDSSQKTFRFAYVSDSQTDGEDLSSGNYYSDTLTGIISNGTPDFILHGGDIAEYSAYESYWHNMINRNKHSFAEIPLMPTSGNHEASYQSAPFSIFNHFNLRHPEQNTYTGIYYSFNYGNAKFIVLDTNNTSGLGIAKEQYDWLISELENNSQKWTIVSMHAPMYSVGPWSSDTSGLILREQLKSVFAQYGVDLVLQGHDHTYSKTYPINAKGEPNTKLSYKYIDGTDYCKKPNGVIYIMTGPAGNQVRNYVDANVTEEFEKYGNSHPSSWAEIEIADKLLTVKHYYYNNGDPEIWESYGIKK